MSGAPSKAGSVAGAGSVKGSARGSSKGRSKRGSEDGSGSEEDSYVEEDEEQEAEKDWDAMRQPESWLLDNGHFADVTVSCGPRSWKLHKAILARESTVWREKFLDPLETEDPIVDYDDDDFEEAIRYGEYVRVRFPFSRFAVESELLIARSRENCRKAS